ncbi:molybdenum ABC transporter ATP-binding protein [Thalassotalea sp. 1_MG-2023]|uniref:molybdenum ABC transporter ATP-binding protein n=1 Tax=Thalassotalea sp. 1_MG-2023 TaxID=3062680 RepID=UPI0026E21A09|nr:molybdenum ABC transporter ATP-binding protein [Thalassotalea sp. 1_MG-2023]MDO6427116.1 molybdenum ABC transporter ATP-binding protein [Thalassotalea sp. 1_MG-2023]
MANQPQLSAKFSLTRKQKSQNHCFELAVDFSIPFRGVTAIFGHSGSGKTTLLRLIAGLEKCQQGQLIVDQHIWQQAEVFLPTHQRTVGYVFQEPSLFDHLTVTKNLQYALKRADSPVTKTHYNEVIQLLALDTLLTRYPTQLSGGEKQRVAIARAIFIQPTVLLMDEPLASLDGKHKAEILAYLESLTAIVNIPIIYVSHSVDEIMRLADHVLVLEAGKISAQGNVFDVFSRLDTRLGQDKGVVLSGKIVAFEPQWRLAKFEFSGGHLWLADHDFNLNQEIRVQVKASDISVTNTCLDDSSVLNRLAAKVVAISEQAEHAMALVQLSVGDSQFIAQLTRKSIASLALSPDNEVWLQVKSTAIVR